MLSLPLDSTLGSVRDPLDAVETAALADAGLLALDARRARPRYFDGRFLTAADLTRDQQYVLARQAELARALGSGVVNGLEVTRGADAREVVVAAGHGITPSGEQVALESALTVALADAAAIRSVTGAFGLGPAPAEPAGSLNGLYILGLRAVEYTANPITAYPTRIDGARTTQDGDIVEAAAVTLIPYPRGAGADQLDSARALAARDIFVRGATLPVPAGVLPLAMLALDLSGVVWIDPHLVRRPAGAFDAGLFGAIPRAQREAYFHQHRALLAELRARRAAANQPPDFPASLYFRALPPAGLMPAACVNPLDFSQNHFPPEVEVALSLVPSDEVAALVDDALRLDPIDLDAGPQDHLSVLVLVPVTRQRLADLAARVASVRRALAPVAPNLAAKQSALTRLRGLRLPTTPAAPVAVTGDDAWREALAGQSELVFVRRRSLATREDPVGTAQRLFGDSATLDARVADSLRANGLVTRVRTLRQDIPTAANADLTTLLASERVNTSPVLLTAAVAELEASRPDNAPLTEREVFAVAERFGDPRLGEGVARIEATDAAVAAPAVRSALATSGVVPELDRVARDLPDANLPEFTRLVADAASRNDTAALRKLAQLH
jgi:hypothetical protein